MWLLASILAATVLRPPPAPGPFGRDFEAYYAAGATWNAGGDPWSRDVWRVERTIAGVDARHDEVLPFAGPPATLPWWSLLARLPFAAARAVWLVVLGLALGTLIAAALALARATARVALPAVALAVVSGPVIAAESLGQVALVAAAAVALALLAFARGGWWGAPATFVAAFQPNLALPLAVGLAGRRARAAVFAGAAAFAVACVALAGGPAGTAAYLRVLAAHAAAERFSAIQYAPAAVVASFASGDAAATFLGVALALTAVLVAVRVARRSGAGSAAGACAAAALAPFVATFFHEQDFAIVLIPAIVLATNHDARVRALAGIGSVAALVDWFGVAQRPAIAAQTIALAGAVACAAGLLAWRSGARPGIALAPLAGAALIAAFAIPLALAVPAPAWPAALGNFHATADAAIGAVWAEEQRRSGLDARVAAWGMLRAIPLAGCALLAVAAWRAGDQSPYRSGFQNGVVMTGVAEKPVRSLL